MQHEQVRQDLLSGRIGLSQNRLPSTSLIEDAEAAEIDNAHRSHWNESSRQRCKLPLFRLPAALALVGHMVPVW